MLKIGRMIITNEKEVREKIDAAITNDRIKAEQQATVETVINWASKSRLPEETVKQIIAGATIESLENLTGLKLSI